MRKCFPIEFFYNKFTRLDELITSDCIPNLKIKFYTNKIVFDNSFTYLYILIVLSQIYYWKNYRKTANLE